MRTISKKLFSVGLVSVMVCLFAVTWAPSPRRADAAADYYAPITATEGTALLGQIHDLITTTHTKYTSYDDCKNPTYVKRTDPGPNGQLMEFYAQAELSSSWQSGKSGTWNREHVWCQSLSNGLWGTSGGGSDLLHIRPTESRVNSTRNNDKYAEFSGGTEVWYRDASNKQIAVAGYTMGSRFMPIDTAKGDVARVVMYVYTHYNTYSNVGGSTNGKGNSGYFGTLKFTNVISAANEQAAAELLLEWHMSDPPDDLERARNEAAEDIQGNRNPFVDHPEYAAAIWGGGSVTPEPVAPDSLKLSPASLSMTVGETALLTVSPTPATADGSVEWSVSDGGVVSVSDGKVTALSEGTATVTAVSKADPSVKAAAQVTVVKPSGVDRARLEAFRIAVANIKTEGSLTVRAASLNKAYLAYLALSDEERAEAEQDVSRMREAVDAYNELVGGYNGEAERAESGAVGGFAAFLG